MRCAPGTWSRIAAACWLWQPTSWNWVARWDPSPVSAHTRIHPTVLCKLPNPLFLHHPLPLDHAALRFSVKIPSILHMISMLGSLRLGRGLYQTHTALPPDCQLKPPGCVFPIGDSGFGGFALVSNLVINYAKSSKQNLV